MIDRSQYIRTLAAGENEGISPEFLTKGTLEALGHPKSPITAIRAKCVDCSGGSQSEARKCTAVNCPLWPFRMGWNPFHKKAKTAA